MLCSRNIISPFVSSSLRSLIVSGTPATTICRQLLPTCFWMQNRVIHIGQKVVVVFSRTRTGFSKTKFVLAIIATAAAGTWLYNLYMYFKGDGSQGQNTFRNYYPYEYYNSSSYYNTYYNQNVNYPSSNYNNYSQSLNNQIPNNTVSYTDIPFPRLYYNYGESVNVSPNWVVTQNRKRNRKRKNRNKKTEAGDCTICLDNVGSGRGKKLPCGHLFHAVCINPWLTQNRSCPNCRQYVPDERVRNIFR